VIWGDGKPVDVKSNFNSKAGTKSNFEMEFLVYMCEQVYFS
jgi:hypothetical protein